MLLQYDTLAKNGLLHFDSWASTFAETQTADELAPEGTGYRQRTRLAKFYGLPELMSMFKEVADIQTADMLNLPRPKANYHTIAAKPSDVQKDMIKELSKRASAVQKKQVKPEQDNMLKITTDGRKIGLDQRLINSLLPDFEGSKVNQCTKNVFKIWEETKQERLTQLIFCDFSTPNKDGRFNVYDDIKTKLLNNGVPEDEIAFIHNADTEVRKKELFAKVRSGKVRILLGSTQKMGTGTNVQDRLIALHDLDCPWRPDELTQRAGRGLRRGNMNPEVHIYRYVTEESFDAYLWQTVEKKQQFISQIMTGKSPMRSCEDIDDTALSYAEIKALCAGDPRIKEKMGLDNEVAKLKMLKSKHTNQRYRLEDKILRKFPKDIADTTSNIDNYGRDIGLLKRETKPNKDGFSPMEINGTVYREKAEAGAALLEICKQTAGGEWKKIGSYRGFKMEISFSPYEKVHKLILRGNRAYDTNLGNDAYGNITRINNTLEEIPKRRANAETDLDNLHKQKENAETEVRQPFKFEQELAEKTERLTVLDKELSMDKINADKEAETDEIDDADTVTYFEQYKDNKPVFSAPDIEDNENETSDIPEKTARADRGIKTSLLGMLNKNIEEIKATGTDGKSVNMSAEKSNIKMNREEK